MSTHCATFVVSTCAAAVLTGSTANASLIVVNDSNAFGLITGTMAIATQDQDFSAYQGFLDSVSGGSGATSWMASANGGLVVGGVHELSTAAADAALVFTFESPDVYAFGGNFYLTNQSFGFITGLIQIELADGSMYVANVTSSQAFSGFVSTGAAISQVSIAPFGTQPGAYATVSEITIGVIPAPSALALLGVAGLGPAGRRRRSR